MNNPKDKLAAENHKHPSKENNSILKAFRQTSEKNTELASYKKSELNTPKINLNIFNSRKLEEIIITAEIVNQMKIYFNSFFSAPPSVINEILSVKKNTIQHPIYAFRGGCFICNKSSVAHLKDERGDIFLEKKKIKLIKNANIFKLLDDSAYMEDDNYLFGYNLNNELNEEESDFNNDGIDNNYNQENYESIDNIEEGLIFNNYNSNFENFVSLSYLSDSNFEFEKEDYRKINVNFKEIKAEIETEIKNVEEIMVNYSKNLNRNTQGQAGINTFSHNSKKKNSAKKSIFSREIYKKEIGRAHV